MYIAGLIFSVLLSCDDNNTPQQNVDTTIDETKKKVKEKDPTVIRKTGGPLKSTVEKQHKVTAGLLLKYLQQNKKITCDELCKWTSARNPRWVVKVENCQMKLEENAKNKAPKAKKEEVLGEVSCKALIRHPTKGRRPLGLCEDQAGGYFAQAAYEEGSAVIAFAQLYQQLQALGAPESLLNRCLLAMDDERRHTVLMSQLAKRYGQKPADIQFAAYNPSILELAIHNAMEGCIGETWSAVMAHYQGQHGGSLLFRNLHQRIAEEETEHAQLSWDIHHWLMSQLHLEQRKEVDLALLQALQQLPQHIENASLDAPDQALGLPGIKKRKQLIAAFVQQVEMELNSGERGAIFSTMQ